MAEQSESTQIPVQTTDGGAPVAPAPTAPAETETAPAPAAPSDPANTELKDVTVDGYTFQVDMSLVDDVDNVELVDKIENEHNLKAIVEFLQKLLGADGYDKLRAYYVEKDGRFKLSKLGEIYQAIFEQFNPKD